MSADTNAIPGIALLLALIVGGMACCSSKWDKADSDDHADRINRFETCMTKDLSPIGVRQTFRQVAPDNSFFVATYGTSQTTELIRIVHAFGSGATDDIKRADDGLESRAAENSAKSCVAILSP